MHSKYLLVVIYLFLQVAYSSQEKPNIIFLLTDDQRSDSVGFMKNNVIQTPNIDYLANSGVIFDKAYVTTAVCAPSRANYYTGTTQRYNGTSFGDKLPKKLYEVSYPYLLQKSGYETMFVGKQGFKFPQNCYDQFWGFKHSGAPYHSKRWGKNKHLTEYMGDRAIEFLGKRQKDKPFCLSIFFRAPHDEAGVFKNINDPRFNDLYKGAVIPEGPLVGKDYFSQMPTAYKQVKDVKLGHYKRYKQWFSNKEERQEVLRTRYRLIAGVDEVVGRLYKELKRQGVDKNTVIIFASDNGFYFGERQFALKHFMHEEAIHIPFFLYDPRLPEGQRKQRLQSIAASIDVAPTMLSLAGIEARSLHQGLDLYKAIQGKEWRKDLLCEHLHVARPPLNDCVLNANWKYIEHFSERGNQAELYNRIHDPYEQYNLMNVGDGGGIPKALEGKVSYVEIRRQQSLLKVRLQELRCHYARNETGAPQKVKNGKRK